MPLRENDRGEAVLRSDMPHRARGRVGDHDNGQEMVWPRFAISTGMDGPRHHPSSQTTFRPPARASYQPEPDLVCRLAIAGASGRRTITAARHQTSRNKRRRPPESTGVPPI